MQEIETEMKTTLSQACFREKETRMVVLRR